MIDAASKAFFHLLARSRGLQRLASRYGLATPASFARRFIAGESTDEAIAAARAVEARGLTQTLDYLGESVSPPQPPTRRRANTSKSSTTSSRRESAGTSR